MRGWWLLPFGWLAVAIVPYPSLPPMVQQLVYVLTTVLVLAALVRAARSLRGAARRPWWLLTGGYLCYFVGDLLYGLGMDSPAGAAPFPWWSDLAYLAYYPFAIVAVVCVMRSRRLRRDHAAWLDSSIWATGAAVVVWAWSIEPNLTGSVGTLGTSVALASPIMDLILVLLLARVVTSPGLRSGSLLLLGTGLFVQLATDMVYLNDALGVGYDNGTALDVGWLTSNVLVAAAALHPSVHAVITPEVSAAEPRLGGRLRVPLLLVPALVGPSLIVGLIVSGRITGAIDGVVAAVASTTVIFGLATCRGIALIRVAEQRADALQVRVDHDSLTGLANRDSFVAELMDVTAAPAPGDRSWAVLFLDLDEFKNVNDTLGHEAGDRLLREVAARLRAAAPESRSVARFGGDEFALLVPAVDVDSVVRRVLHALQAPLLLGDREVQPAGSIGVATTDETSTVADLLRQADVAMYDAKRSGRAWTHYQAGMSAALLARLDLRAQLVQALADGEVVPWFQPVVDLRTGRLCGFEALARWVPPGRQPVSPDVWLPLAEESGLVVAVDRSIMEAALEQLAAWRSDGRAQDLHVAVNLSGRTLQREGIEDEVLDALLRARIPADRLVVEVTEGVLIEGDEVSPRLQSLRAAGVRIALDDFGTGWSSLGYLRRFPVDQLKLDRSFTAELGEHADADAIPAAVIQLAGALGLDVVAEGVETDLQRCRLVDLGFDVAQGYLYSAALPAEELDGWVRPDRLDQPDQPDRPDRPDRLNPISR